VKEKNRQEVVIERGMADKQRIILAGAGDEEVPFIFSAITNHDTSLSPGLLLAMWSSFLG
jgi:hypothetical protein